MRPFRKQNKMVRVFSSRFFPVFYYHFLVENLCQANLHCLRCPLIEKNTTWFHDITEPSAEQQIFPPPSAPSILLLRRHWHQKEEEGEEKDLAALSSRQWCQVAPLEEKRSHDSWSLGRKKKKLHALKVASLEGNNGGRADVCECFGGAGYKNVEVALNIW